MDGDEPFAVKDASHLTSDDLIEVHRWQLAYQTGGIAELSRLMDELAVTDPAKHVRLLEAFWPEAVRQAIHGQLAAAGMDEEEIQLLVRKLESRLRDQ